MKSLTFRLNDDVYQELSELSDMTGLSKNKLIDICIRDEYEKCIGGDEKVKQAFETLNQFKEFFESMNNKINA